MSQQRKLSSMKTWLSDILHFWNNGQGPPATISRMTKTHLRTVKYNTVKIKQQCIIEDQARKGRPRKITASYSIALTRERPWMPYADFYETLTIPST